MRKKLSEAHKGIRPTERAKANQRATWARKCKTPYSFTSPEGKVYDNVRNLREFAREHNLNARALGLLWTGKIRYFKKWTKTGISLPSYQLVSPTKHIFTGMLLKKLCIDNNVNYKMVHKYCLGMNKPYQGWMAKQLT
jgi:hypothetical protein